jgi:hypothetical protein
MLKLIGILIGSALAVAFLILALGVPEFSAPEPEPAIATEPVEELVTDTVPEPIPETVPAPLPVADPVPDPGEVPEPAVALQSDPETEALIEQIFNPGPEDMIEENWYAFWSPFRSEIAAQGFVSKLQETTGMDYRVVKIKTGVYEVAFAYVDDADIEDKLARISSATGLNMTDG